MKITRNNALAVCMAAVALIGFAGLCNFAMREGNKKICEATKIVFKQTVIDDLHNRLFPISRSVHPLGRKVKKVQIAVKGGVETIEFKDSIDERIADQMVDQFVLADLNPLNPDTFNLLFQKILAKNNMTPVKTGIVYQYKGEKHYSGNDSTIAESSIVLPPDTLDLKKEASVQAWVKYAPTSIIKHVSQKIWWCGGIYIACCTGIGLLLFRKQVKRKQAEEKQKREADRILEMQAQEEKQEKKKEELLGQAVKVGDMILYENSRTIFAQGESHTLSRYTFDLLLLFAKAPHHTLTADAIKAKFWPEHADPRNNMYNLISKLKKSIEPFSRCEVISEGEEVYRLMY